jgi:hypothetical protein
MIFKEIDGISIVMRREVALARKTANNKAKTTNPITATALVKTVTTKATNMGRRDGGGPRKK